MSSDAGRRPNRNLSARVGRRRIGAGELSTSIPASSGICVTCSDAEQALSGDSNGAVTAEGCPEGTPNCESNLHELNNQIPSLPSNSRLTPIDNLSLPSRTAGSQDDEHPEPGFQSHFAQDNQGLQTDSSEGVNDIAPCDTDILPNVEVSLLQQPQMFLSSSWKANELFHHYVTNVADILLPVTHPGNPYRSMYAPAALEGSLYFESGAFNAAPNIGLCIFHSLISTSAFHLHRCYNFKSEYYRLGIIHRQLALESLQMVLMKDVPLLNYKTILVALLSMVTIGDSLTSNDNRSYCYEFTFGITADIAAAIQEITDLYECLQFYRQAQAPIPEGLLEACEDLGDRLLSWTLSADKVPSFNDRGTDELDIFKHHSHAWHGAALIFYLNCIQGAKPQDLVDEVATVASHMLAVEEIKSKHIANQMAPISWPAFIASCCALNREPWEAWWLDVQKYGIGSIRRQYTIVQEIWSEMDTNSSEGWLQILHRRDIQVLAA
ncbi:unnamed protein product [Aspergillus oryzae]|nr:unnamed protein product [Aspergillus oryzae]